MVDRQTLTLAQVSFGAIAHDRITGVKGTVTAKCEYQNGYNTVCIEGLTSTGSMLLEWVSLKRLELDI